MDSVILQGQDALAAAKYLMRALDTVAFDLGPDYGQDTARVYFFTRVDKPVDWVLAVRRWIDLGWFDKVGAIFTVEYDAGKFRLGNDVAVEGTPL